ncbi:lysoplasmalogenase family protein [Mariniflexile jejuense]|uniref:Lysoplasmalogenase family protein n=1 Tax=Mariniflexile jejuense TaxID=1173582 RepID=A0ABW3JJ70_9FLAO
MLKSIYLNKIKFTVVFVTVLFIDVCIKIYLNNNNYRFFSKPLILISLIAYYYINMKHKRKKVERNVVFALFFFLLGDFMILNYLNKVFLVLSMLFFAVGKLFFCLKFKSKEDFEFSRLFPFSIIVYLGITFVISLIYKNLKAFLIPGLITLFISLLMLNLAYLRKAQFSKFSYFYVLFGCLLFVLVESINAVNTFNKILPFPSFFNTIFYGISMYLIILGITEEDDDVLKSYGELN